MRARTGANGTCWEAETCTFTGFLSDVFKGKRLLTAAIYGMAVGAVVGSGDSKLSVAFPKQLEFP